MDRSEARDDREWTLPSSVFEVYDELLVPLVFQAYADDVAARVAPAEGGAVLEVAAGTGVVTRLLADTLAATVEITATDIVPGMLEQARQIGTSRPVTWEQANALALPYEPSSFDVVVCSFGAMFFDPPAAAFAEARRVLRPGGRFLCTVWDQLERNDFALTIHEAVQARFRDAPPRFLERKPYSYHDPDMIRADLETAGFEALPEIRLVEHTSRAATAVAAATAFCGGTPLRDELAGGGEGRLGSAVAAASDRLAARFGASDLEGGMSAHLVEIAR